MLHHGATRLTAGALAAIVLTACGGGDNGMLTAGPPGTPPPGSYDLRTAMSTLEKGGLSAAVKLSGNAIVNGTATAFTGTGVLTLSPGANGMFNGKTQLLQTETISGTVSVAGQSSPYSSTIVTAYDGTTGAILGESESHEFDVAQAPILIPTTVGAAVVLGTLSRYTDDTQSVVLGTTQVSAGLLLATVDGKGPEVVQFTYKVYDTSQALVETDNFNYYLSEDNVLTLYSYTAQSASGTLSVTPQ
ncbi:MAG: hypothetical protein JWL65_2895 [Gammaproteobacteria bacterium]|nr:hypothetical protein [Gammaproteobacteria bacterium]